jgi:hypothetical protein
VVSARTTAATLTPAGPAGGNGDLPSGLAHVATASFLASRAAPSAGFWIALPGGAALARAGGTRGLRAGYGSSIAAMLETVAIMGPARFGVPLTQAISAPLIGRLQARGASVLGQVLACAAIRLVHTTLTVAFFAILLAGGLDAYTDFYDAVAGHIPLLPEGRTAALISTAVSLVLWAAFASTLQVLVYQRSLRHWSQTQVRRRDPSPSEPESRARRRFDPRAIVLASVVAFGLLLVSTKWPLLAAAAAWLAVAWTLSGGDREVLPAGALIALFLAGGVLVFTMIGGAGFESALRRAVRAALLVAVATWVRSAAGSDGLREVSRRALRRLRRLPSIQEASKVMDDLGSGRQLGGAARSLLEALRAVRKRPLVVADAVLAWVAAEAASFHAPLRSPPARLSLRARDALLVALAAAPALALAA